MMVITVLEAKLAPDRVADIQRAYRDAISVAKLPPGIVETFLVRDAGDPLLYRIISVWTGRPALEAMRASGEKPKGVQVFQAAGATPEVSLLEVIAHGKRG